MQQRLFRAMGCDMLALVDCNGACPPLASIVGWFEIWEQQLSRFRATSDLARLNARTGQAVVVRPVLWAVIACALDAAQQSDGLVDPALLDALEAAGYDRSFTELPHDADMPVRSPAGAGGWRMITRDPQTQTVTLPPNLRLDLGGIAKGWAADQAVRQLAATGPALVDAGGDIAVSGPMADGAPWPIEIADPFSPEAALGTVLLTHGAVATSGRDYRRWRRGGVAQHHIIDPRTGRPAQTDVLAATVIGPDGPTAEMAAKAALILGSRAGGAWLDARPELAGLLVCADGAVLHSQQMPRYLA